MSDVRSGDRHVDPLEALRAADHRPLQEIWRERTSSAIAQAARTLLRSRVHLLVLAAVAAAIGWRMFVATEPPVEASIPFAPRASAEVETAQVAKESAAGALASPDIGNPASLSDVAAVDAVGGDVVIHVAGAVQQPGLVVGRSGWRVNDAVAEAGGAMAHADLDRVNLAALVVDGERVFIPFVGEDPPTVVASSSPSAPESFQPVDLNTASAVELESLPGIGPATAATILAHREEHGPFGTIDALVAVRGIGPATLETLRDHVRVG